MGKDLPATVSRPPVIVQQKLDERFDCPRGCDEASACLCVWHDKLRAYCSREAKYFGTFTRAEDYHQMYLTKYGGGFNYYGD